MAKKDSGNFADVFKATVLHNSYFRSKTINKKKTKHFLIFKAMYDE